MTTNRYSHSPPNRSAGFTLIEVLIAVLVLSIGLLGLAALQTSGLGMNHSAYLRSQATILAADMADRMRANRAGLSAYDNTGTTAPTAVAGCTSTAGCNSTQLAQDDMAAWAADVAAQLPSGVGIVCPDASPNDGDSPANPAPNPNDPKCTGSGDVFAIKIWWIDDRSIQGATNCDGTASAIVAPNIPTGSLQCFVVSFQP